MCSQLAFMSDLSNQNNLLTARNRSDPKAVEVEAPVRRVADAIRRAQARAKVVPSSSAEYPVLLFSTIQPRTAVRG
jgi:hypothetical protein